MIRAPRSAWWAVSLLLAACGGGGEPDGGQLPDASSVSDSGTPDAGQPVVCASPCADFEVCERGACVSRSLALQWLAPGDGTNVDAGLVHLAAQLVTTPGRPADEVASLTAELRSSSDAGTRTATLVADGGVFSGEVVLERGEWTATVSRGVLTGRQTFWVGPLPLALRVTFGPRPDAGMPSTAFEPFDPVRPESYRRDLVLPIRISSDTGELDASSVVVELRSGADALTLPGMTCPPELACGPSPCACFAADLSALRLDALNGLFPLSVTARDVYGLQAQDSSPGVGSRLPAIPVTRWGWRARFFTPMGTSPVLGPFVALDGAGRVIVAETQDVRSVTACFSTTGAPCWQRPGRVEAPPLVSSWPDAGQVVHLPNFADGTAIATIDTQAGTLVAQPPVTAFTAVAAPMTLLDDGADSGVPLLAGLSHDGDPTLQRLFAWGPSTWTTAAPGAIGGFPTAVTGAGSRLLWSAQRTSGGSVLLRQDFDGGVWDGLSAQVATGLAARHLVSAGDVVVGARAGEGPGSWFGWDQSSGSGWSFTPGATADALAFVMPTAGELIGTRYRGTSGATEIVRLPLDGGAALATQPMPSPSLDAPALGADGRVYALDVSGALRVLGGQSLVSQWSYTFVGERFEKAPLLDCARDASGAVLAGRPGRLVVAGSSGRLYSLIVDARGADPAAPWPLVFHDPANTNNTATPLANFSCP